MILLLIWKIRLLRHWKCTEKGKEAEKDRNSPPRGKWLYSLEGVIFSHPLPTPYPLKFTSSLPAEKENRWRETSDNCIKKIIDFAKKLQNQNNFIDE